MRRAALLTWTVAALGFASPAAAADLVVEQASVGPQRIYFAGAAEARIAFRIKADAPADVEIRIAGRGETVRRINQADVPTGDERTVGWDGLDDSGRPAPDGKYVVSIGSPGGPGKRIETVTLHGHIFPVRGPHGARGPVGEFGAARNGGRIHQGFDVTARCGTPLVAARGGTVVRRRFDARLDGNFVLIAGRKEGRTYRYSHLIRPSPLRRGDRVHTGDVVGHVGQTGNARSTPCHLHFELRQGRRFLDPKPHLLAWDRYS